MPEADETLARKVARVVREEIALAPYDPAWPGLFEAERDYLRSRFPGRFGRVEHFGSTAVPGLTAKPIVDMLIEVASLDDTRRDVAPVLEGNGYDYFWRPTWGDDTPPFYCWFIKRDGQGRRTHHLHMVEPWFEHWDRLLFRDHLIAHPDTAMAYGRLKRELAQAHPNDRAAYTQGKTAFIAEVMRTIRAARG